MHSQSYNDNATIFKNIIKAVITFIQVYNIVRTQRVVTETFKVYSYDNLALYPVSAFTERRK